MKRIAWIALLVWCGSAAADDRSAVLGRWATDGSIIEISTTDGTLQARVIALREPVYRAGEAGPAGSVRVDLNNPDAALRGRPIIGIDLLSDYTWDGKLWRGYIGMPMFGRTQVFAPVSSCSGNIPQMLALAQLTSTC